MAVTNTGIVLRTITGVNESDLFLDSEATSVTTNTGIVERSIVGVHDANFVRPLGDELISNGGFDTDSNWGKGTGWTISGGSADFSGGTDANLSQNNIIENGKEYLLEFDLINLIDGGITVRVGNISVTDYTLFESKHYALTTISDGTSLMFRSFSNTSGFSIDNVSVKEMLVNRESTATNTGIVERSLTGVNESDLWLDSESTSVVNNTGIVERPITGVNESDPMFPDNTISNIVNIAGLISSLIADLKARATTFENEEATQEILINLQKC